MDELWAESLAGARLSVEPLRPGHADEMHPVLADPRLYAFTGGQPPTPGMPGRPPAGPRTAASGG
ncbi:GNAT family N-acetyltransferase [Amycolatopsis saalfeldensis]|uniref:GNAT family N-acetyltransferase n=1 Tax=Amycolatopsis saalfeldensis TaxID=394193 RepID=A0A1H8T178_9PSEU|nr:GNAT family N-acetyltransferase [Amycolatopsis saalfeldensis]SEO84253.1 hypothetical protein SAMN04489732_102361 [Amycolatopsis saalfeldensis]